ncbi:hypothetical protein [Sphingomonas sanxanigenens]|uniref:Uncharacterized protein n=1 Tax=Sphingomonas sanxanigenens DSM 19645 = NX02 TaxID=1123269 RepID=W0ADX6_9SPHN|nr:hypothetical protein [Sphingomonas sanxanigenens]AHE53890.1 hypothetical protein NX02_10880 [Sphingomonas sanxanigenens DSM 19645 = NX02]
MSDDADDFIDRMFAPGGPTAPKAEPRPQRRMRAIVSNHHVDYAHNDVANAAWFFKERLTKALQDKERSDGIFLDMMAMATMTAFALEGYVNFVGMTLIERGHEGDSAKGAWLRFEKKSPRDKIKVIRRLTGEKIDWNKRPYRTVRDLMGLRNMLAHPKAHRAEQREFEAVGTEDELKKMLRDYRPEYERQLTWDFVTMAYEDVEAIWNELLGFAKIEAHETWSAGMQGLEFLEHVDEE